MNEQRKQQQTLTCDLLTPNPLLLLHHADTEGWESAELPFWPETVCWLDPEWTYWNGGFIDMLKNSEFNHRSLSLSLSLSHTHTHTHTHRCYHTVIIIRAGMPTSWALLPQPQLRSARKRADRAPFTLLPTPPWTLPLSQPSRTVLAVLCWNPGREIIFFLAMLSGACRVRLNSVKQTMQKTQINTEMDPILWQAC